MRGRWGQRSARAGEDPFEREADEKNDHDEPEPNGESLATDGAPGSSNRRALDDWHDLGGLKVGLGQSDDLGLAHARIAKHGGRLVRRRGHAGYYVRERLSAREVGEVGGVRALSWGARCHRAKKPLPVRAELGRDLRVVMQPGCCDLRGRAFECPLAGEAFDEHETERVDIDTRTYGRSLDLFGSEVGGGAEHEPGRGDVNEPGDPEVGEMGCPGLIEEDVCRLDVTMHDPLLVYVRERRGDTRTNLGRVLARKPANRKALGEGGPFDEFHHEVRASLELTGIQQSNEVRMSEASEGLDLNGKADLGAVRDFAQHLDGDGPVEASVERPIDAAHPAAPEQRLQAVATVEERGEERIGREGSGWGWTLARARHAPHLPTPKRRCGLRAARVVSRRCVRRRGLFTTQHPRDGPPVT